MADSRSRAALAAAALVILPACAGETAPSPPSGSPPGCPAGEAPLEDGSCRPAGVPPELCGDGFELDSARGCTPLLPAEPCARGLTAVPGEEACHDVAPCAAGRWGDIPVDATTQFVDGRYAGADSDGSQAKPWITIQSAVAVAAPSAIVAMAEGTYAEAVRTQNKPVRLWGRCPALVVVTGDGSAPHTLLVGDAADGTELRDFAVSGSATGVALSGSEDVLLERMWIHDTGNYGVAARSDLGPTAVTLARSLVEQASVIGVLAAGSSLTLEASEVRDTSPGALVLGRGVHVEQYSGVRANAGIRSSLVARNYEAGISVGGSDVIIERTVIRDTRPHQTMQDIGDAIIIQEFMGPSDATVRSTVTEHGITGVFVSASTALLEGLTVRDTQPPVRFMTPAAIVAQAGQSLGQRANITLVLSLIERAQGTGVQVRGSDATVDGVAVRDIMPQPFDGLAGHGIHVSYDPQTGDLGSAQVRFSTVERSLAFGVVVVASSLTIDASVIGETGPQASGLPFGDGLDAMTFAGIPASIVVRDTLVRASARAGIASFGASVQVSRSIFECNAVHLDAETYTTFAASLEDLGGNTCGCNGAAIPCKAESTALAPPEHLGAP